MGRWGLPPDFSRNPEAATNIPGRQCGQEERARLPRGVRPRLEGKPRTPLSSRVATRVSWSPLSGLKGPHWASPCDGERWWSQRRRPGGWKALGTQPRPSPPTPAPFPKKSESLPHPMRKACILYHTQEGLATQQVPGLGLLTFRRFTDLSVYQGWKVTERVFKSRQSNWDSKVAVVLPRNQQTFTQIGRAHV